MKKEKGKKFVVLENVENCSREHASIVREFKRIEIDVLPHAIIIRAKSK